MEHLSSLVIYHKQLGDVLMLEPALAKLRHATNAPVTLATRSAFAPMLALMDDVEPMADSWFRRAERVVSYEPRGRACWQALTTLAPEKCLFVPKAHHLKPWHALCFPTQRLVVDSSPYYRAKYLFQTMPVTSTMAFRPPHLAEPPEAWRPVGLPQGYILLHVTSAWRRKSWLPEYWATVVSELTRQGWGPFVITGGGAEWELAYVRHIVDLAGVEILNLSGKTSLAQYLSVIAGARALLCIDGSSSHIAAAFGIPTVTLFGPSSPLHWHWPLPGSVALSAQDFTCETKPSAVHIPPAAVLAAFAQLMISGV